MSRVMDNTPFMHRRNDDNDNDGYKVDFKAIAQALVVAATVGIAVMYSDQSKIIQKLDSMSSDIEDIKENQSKFRNDFYSPRN